MSLTAEQQAAVVAEAHTWMGTPYHHHARIKGAGVDCAQILCEVYERAGVVPHVETGHYPTDWHLHRSEEMYQGWLDRFCVPTSDPQAGDIALFKFGRTFSHGAIMITPDMAIHSYVERGVIMTRLSEEPLAHREVMFWTFRG